MACRMDRVAGSEVCERAASVKGLVGRGPGIALAIHSLDLTLECINGGRPFLLI